MNIKILCPTCGAALEDICGAESVKCAINTILELECIYCDKFYTVNIITPALQPGEEP
jgi:LSD1 subclass zinc finger protein